MVRCRAVESSGGGGGDLNDVMTTDDVSFPNSSYGIPERILRLGGFPFGRNRKKGPKVERLLGKMSQCGRSVKSSPSFGFCGSLGVSYVEEKSLLMSVALNSNEWFGFSFEYE